MLVKTTKTYWYCAKCSYTTEQAPLSSRCGACGDGDPLTDDQPLFRMQRILEKQLKRGRKDYPDLMGRK